VGRIARGGVSELRRVVCYDVGGKRRNGVILKLMGHHGLHRIDVDEAAAGDIVCISGLTSCFILDTCCDRTNVKRFDACSVEATVEP